MRYVEYVDSGLGLAKEWTAVRCIFQFEGTREEALETEH